ncbi:MAG TPA: hypothetical protein VK446_08480 [Methylocystis sp.]|nr:hypothetical protein [Methylocystis sp.]
MRQFLRLRTAATALLALAAATTAGDALAWGSRGGGFSSGVRPSAPLPLLPQHFRNGARHHGGYNGGGADNTGGRWEGGSGFGPGLGQHWVPDRGSLGYGGFEGGSGGYGGERNDYGFGYSGHGGYYHPWPNLRREGRFARRRGCEYGGCNNGNGGYWGGGGVYYPDSGYDYGDGSDYAQGRPAVYDGFTGYPPALNLAPPSAYERLPIPLQRVPTVAYQPTIINVAAPSADDPHVIYVDGARNGGVHPRPGSSRCARDCR